MKKQDDSNNIYSREYWLIDKVNNHERNQDLSKDDLLKDYLHLGKAYSKLLKQMIKITRIGDASQMKLMRSWELEQEKQQLAQIVKDWAKEIEKKNQQLESQTNLLKDKSEKLKEMSEIKSRFFANISHEFRTPLTLMLRNSQRLLGLINQLLELSKFESGRMKLQTSLQNIIPFAKGIAASFELLAQQNELAITFQSQEEDMGLYFDPEKLEEVLYNVLLNGIKFTPPGGTINIEVSRSKEKDHDFSYGSVDISVSDTGLGIPADRLEHIFDRFYQVKGYESKHKGSGIGLAIAKEVTELHHGKISVSSRQGSNSGTVFNIRLPRGDSHLAPEEIIDISERPYSQKSHAEIRELYMAEKNEKESLYGEKSEKGAAERANDSKSDAQDKFVVLIVEDSPEVRNYVKGSLEPEFKVIEAANGREGIDTAKQVIPDIIISDIVMPEVDGYGLCKALKTDINTSHIPIILLTVKADAENILQGLQTGVDDYITKPFNTKILLARIKNLIDLRNQLQQNVKREMTLQPVKISISQMDKDFLKEVQVLINKNISDADFNVDLLCKKQYMSRATMYRKILALTGETPTEFIRSYRLKRGAQLLKNNFGTILEVALEVGFSSSSYFTKCFKEKFHQLPSTFLSNHSAEDDDHRNHR